MTSALASTSELNRDPDAVPGGRPTALYLGRNLRMGGAERVWVSYVNHARRVRPVGVLLDARGALLAEVDDRVPVYDLSATDPVVGPDRRRTGQAPGAPSIEKWKIFREARRLARIVRETKAEVVSSFLMRSHMVAALARDLWCRDVKLVFNVHSMMIQSAPLLYQHAGSRAIMKGFLRYGFPRAERVVAVAEGVADELRGHVPELGERLSVVHNPVDLETIRAAASEGGALPAFDGPVIVAAGRLVWLKGVDVLLDALARFTPERRPRLVLVGDGEEAPILERQVRRLDLADHVHFVGQTTNPWAHMSQATVLVLASRTEAFPSVIGEAMALGVPVVATKCAPGIEDYLCHGECGVLVPPEDPAALAEALERVLGDAVLRKRLAERGRDRVEDFRIERAIDRYEDLLLDVVRG